MRIVGLICARHVPEHENKGRALPMNDSSPYRDLYNWSVNDPTSFWQGQAEAIHWQTPFDTVCDFSNPPWKFIRNPKFDANHMHRLPKPAGVLHADGSSVCYRSGREVKTEIPRKILMCLPSQHHVISGTVNSAGSSKESMMEAQP